MKGIVFTELLELVEDKFGLEVVDEVINSCELASGGAYTAVGTYPDEEALALIGALSEKTGVPVSKLANAFGHHLFGRFIDLYSELLAELDDTLTFLGSIHQVIHVAVKRLYPDASLPTIGFEQTDENEWVMKYDSSRPLADLAQGLIEATIAHFGEPFELARQDDFDAAPGTSAKFTITRLAEVEACPTT